MSEGTALAMPRISEERVPRRGYFLLIPWMAIGTIWIQANTGLDQATVTFYFGLLIAGSLSLLTIGFVEPKMVSDLTRLKLLPFILFFGIFMAGIFVVFGIGNYVTNGSITKGSANAFEFVNFLALTILIIAPVETLVFQYIAPKLWTMTLAPYGMASLGAIFAQFTFGGFHYFAYGGSAISMALAVALGLGFYAIRRASDTWGLGGAMGAHAGWNISVTVFRAVMAGTIIGGWGVLH